MSETSAAARIAEGAWMLALTTPTLPPATATNTAVFGHDRLVIVEPATPHANERARLDALLDALVAEGRTLAAIVLTHHHVDHIGYATALRERHGVPILAHAQTAARLDFPIDETIAEGWTMALGGGHTLEVRDTPGHAPGHLLVWDRGSGVAHAGDLVAGEGTILVDVRDGGDMTIYLDSLARTRAWVGAARAEGRPLRFIPAHGPILDDPAVVLDHYVNHRLAREDKIRRAVVDDGRRTFVGILAGAYVDTPKRLWPLAALSVEAHLRKLVADGELRRVGKGARPT